MPRRQLGGDLFRTSAADVLRYCNSATDHGLVTRIKTRQLIILIGHAPNVCGGGVLGRWKAASNVVAVFPWGNTEKKARLRALASGRISRSWGSGGDAAPREVFAGGIRRQVFGRDQQVVPWARLVRPPPRGRNRGAAHMTGRGIRDPIPIAWPPIPIAWPQCTSPISTSLCRAS